MKEVVKHFVSALIFCALLVSSAGAQEDDAIDGGTLVYGEVGNPTTLEPVTSNDSISDRLIHMIFNSMVTIDENLDIKPELAESWEIKTNGDGDTEFIFKLREDVQWHDRKPFTSADVVFTFRAILDPRTQSSMSSRYKGIVRKMEALDKYTVKVTLVGRNAFSIGNMNFKIIPKHKFRDTALVKTLSFMRKPVGTGPFKLFKWLNNETVMLNANKKYFKGRPYLDQVIMRVFPDKTVMMAELETGTIDMIIKAQSEDIERLKANPDFEMYIYPEMSYSFIAYNTRHPFLGSKEVRKALTFATNRKGMLDSIFDGKGQILSGPFAPISWAYNPLVRPFPFRPGKARKILEKEGFKDTDGDGILEKDGKPFILRLKCFSGYETAVQTTLIFQQNMKDIGIQVDLEFSEWSVFVNEVFEKLDYDVTTLSWKLGIDPDIYGIFHSSQIGPGKNNFAGYSSAQVDDLLEKGRTSFDFRTRRAIYNKLHDIIHEDQPYTFLWSQRVHTPISKRFRGIKKNPLNILHNVSEWWVPEELQR